MLIFVILFCNQFLCFCYIFLTDIMHLFYQYYDISKKIHDFKRFLPIFRKRKRFLWPTPNQTTFISIFPNPNHRAPDPVRFWRMKFCTLAPCTEAAWTYFRKTHRPNWKVETWAARARTKKGFVRTPSIIGNS